MFALLQVAGNRRRDCPRDREASRYLVQALHPARMLNLCDQAEVLCRQFKCLWLVDERLGEEWRPSISGIVLEFDDDTKVLHAVIDPEEPAAHLEEPYRSGIERMRRWGKRSPEPFEVVISGPP